MRYLIFTLLAFSFLSCHLEKEKVATKSISSGFLKPYEEFFMQRAYPDEYPNIRAYTAAMEEAQQLALLKNEFPGFEEPWEVRGPGNIGARINTIAVHPENEDITAAGCNVKVVMAAAARLYG